MAKRETAIIAKPFYGDLPYQVRARAALPMLVRQAKAQQTIFYSDLAREMGMPNARNLNYVLGSVGETLNLLCRKWQEDIPPIQCLVINRATKLPGEGVGFFLTKQEYKSMSKRQLRLLVQSKLEDIFSYPDWDRVLAAFDMQPVRTDVSKLARQAASGGRGGGESEVHRQLKEHVAKHPGLLGLSDRVAKGETEYGLPSGDGLDVLFRDGDDWIAVEVKSHISSDDDLLRGIFQCVKYQAVLEAFLLTTDRKPNVRTVLLTTRRLTAELVSVKNLLGIEVMEVDTPAGLQAH